MLMLNVDAVCSLAKTDPALAWALAEEVTRRLYEVLEAFAGNVFGSVRQRVACHLLDLAADRQQGAVLIAPVSQQVLADQLDAEDAQVMQRPGISLALAILGAGYVVAAAAGWIGRWWSRAVRLQYAALAVGVVVLVAQLAAWDLIGWGA
jgi:CRP-like cAMP-binding protein